jgi:hypothetical protein
MNCIAYGHPLSDTLLRTKRTIDAVEVAATAEKSQAVQTFP